MSHSAKRISFHTLGMKYYESYQYFILKHVKSRDKYTYNLKTNSIS